MSLRYAVYFSPAHASPWWNFGADWLGRDECNNHMRAQPTLVDISPSELHGMTEEPRRYGFHATLKAPFRLKEAFDQDDLTGALHDLSKQLQPVELGHLHVAQMGQFVALLPLTASAEITALAAHCVVALDDFRAPLTDAEIARRHTETLDARGQALLAQYGYPHVLERFTFHFTLSGRVAPLVAQQIVNTLAEPVHQLNLASPLLIDRLCLFVEEAPGKPFRRLADMVLGG